MGGAAFHFRGFALFRLSVDKQLDGVREKGQSGRTKSEGDSEAGGKDQSKDQVETKRSSSGEAGRGRGRCCITYC